MASIYGEGIYGEGIYGGALPLFTPPMRKQVAVIDGAMRYSFLVSPTVWKDANGVWQVGENPRAAEIENAQRVLTSTGPVTVDSATAAELIAAGIGTIT